LAVDVRSELARMVEMGRRRVREGEDPYQVVLKRARALVADQFTPAQLSAATDDVTNRIREMVHLLVDGWEHGAHVQGLPALPAAAQVIEDRVLRDILGYGPLDPFLRDERIEEIIVNGTSLFVISEDGKQQVDVALGREEEIIALVNRLVAPTGRQVTTTNPILDAQLPDGSRINVTIAPIASPSPQVVIRRHRLVARSLEDLVRLETITQELADFLVAAVRSRLSLLVAGGVATGKTNFLNVLGGLFEPDERVVVIEDTRELQLPLADSAYMVTRAATLDGLTAIDQKRLVRNVLRQRPDRVVIGEVRGEEALDMLNAANSGQRGLLCSVHANSSFHALRRLEQLARMSPDSQNVPQKTLLEWIAGAFQLIVFLCQESSTGRRLVTEVLELTGQVESSHILHQPLFEMKGDRTLRRTPYHLGCAATLEAAGFDPRRFQPPIGATSGG